MKNATSYRTTPEVAVLKATIRDLWETESLTASQIALRIGGLTRNQVIGHVTRMNLATRTGIVRTFTPRPNRPRSPPKPLVAAPPQEAPPSYNLDLMAVTDRTCRFPYGDGPSYSFCGHAPKPSSPYCAFHSQVCHVPAPTRLR